MALLRPNLDIDRICGLAVDVEADLTGGQDQGPVENPSVLQLLRQLQQDPETKSINQIHGSILHHH